MIVLGLVATFATVITTASARSAYDEIAANTELSKVSALFKF